MRTDRSVPQSHLRQVHPVTEAADVWTTSGEYVGAMYNRNTMCYVESLTYNFKRCVGMLWMPPLNCTDMVGVISLFAAIDARVKLILTFAGKKRDTTYRRDGDLWEVIPAPLEGDDAGAF